MQSLVSRKPSRAELQSHLGSGNLFEVLRKFDNDVMVQRRAPSLEARAAASNFLTPARNSPLTYSYSMLKSVHTYSTVHILRQRTLHRHRPLIDIYGHSVTSLLLSAIVKR